MENECDTGGYGAVSVEQNKGGRLQLLDSAARFGRAYGLERSRHHRVHAGSGGGLTRIGHAGIRAEWLKLLDICKMPCHPEGKAKRRMISGIAG